MNIPFNGRNGKLLRKALLFRPYMEPSCRHELAVELAHAHELGMVCLL